MTQDVQHYRLSIIPGWIVTDARLKGKDLQVLCLLGRHTSSKDGWCRRSQVKMAAELSCSRSTIQASLDRLAEMDAIEKRVVMSPDGRDSAHRYRVIYDSAPESVANSAWEDEDAEENHPTVQVDNDTPPAGISAGGADSGQAPPAGSGPAPINYSNLTTPLNQEERERVRGLSDDDPKKIEKQFDALMIGRHGNPWPKVLGSSRGWAMRQFINLTAEERAKADDRRDAYLAACPKIKSGEDKGKPNAVALGVYLRDKMFNYVDAVAPRIVERQLARKAEGERIRVAPFGPIWAGLRMLPLLDDPVQPDMARNVFDTAVYTYEAHRRTSIGRAQAFLDARGITIEGGKFIFPDGFYEQEYRRRVKQEGYPETNRLNKLAADRAHETADPRYAAFSDLCEPVPTDSSLFDAWRQFHEDRNIPFVPDAGGMKVVWFPKGGPDAIYEFEIAARAALGLERGDDDAA